MGVGEEAQWVRELPVLPENQSSVPNTSGRQLTACITAASASLYPLLMAANTSTHGIDTHTDTHVPKIKINLFKFLIGFMIATSFC